MADIINDTDCYFHAQGDAGEITVAGGQINGNNGGICLVIS